MISEMIAYCEIYCNECEAFKATQTKDVEWKKQIAKHWSDQGEIKLKARARTSTVMGVRQM